jgi:hypothetical protein
VRNEIETKRNRTKRNEIKRNETKPIETKRNDVTFRFVSFGFVSFCLISFGFVSFRFYFVSYFTGTLVRPCSFSICLSLFNLLLILYVSCFVSYNRHWFVLIFTVSYLFLFFITGLHSEGGLSADVTPSHFMCLSQVKRYFKKSLR